MIGILKKQSCCGCGACEQVCPKHCITMKADKEGFLYPEVDADACVHCGLCEKVCPILVAAEATAKYPQAVYAAFAADEQIRSSSSSGGIFTLAAEWVLARGGSVFGAGFAEDFSVHHIKIETIEQLYLLRGSKYLQSRTESAYLEAEADLKQGRVVLFSGTGCQIAGLKQFLRKEYDNLYTVDVLCHGVPSAELWSFYLQEKEKMLGDKITMAYFRDKTNGWHAFSSKLTLKDGKEYNKHHNDDEFMKAFLSDICLRPSCHACKFREGRAGADLTLGDAWGIERWMPELDDDRGTSVVFVNSSKGKLLWDAIQMQTISKQADFGIVVKHNSAYEKSVKPHPNRKRFFRALDKGASLDELIRLSKKPLWKRIIYFAKKYLKKLLKK